MTLADLDEWLHLRLRAETSMNPSQASVSCQREKDLAIENHHKREMEASLMLNPSYWCHDRESELAHSQHLSDMQQETQD